MTVRQPAFGSIAPVFSPSVDAARQAGAPVVALESTVISHGLPFPRNLETALAVEDLIRAEGATPATIACFAGQLRVGLEACDIEFLARSRGVSKLSRSDLAHAIVSGANGSMTVAATMVVARLAGIGVFATGGIGGVHRGAPESFDVSADLRELATTSVTVVSAGAKAILDLPKTLETLESLGVPVLVFQSDEFPAFWSRKSGLPSPLRVDSIEEIVRMHRVRADLGLAGGQLIANPIPVADEVSASVIESAVESAVKDASALGIRSKALTPFLLERVRVATDGKSLAANVALLKNNARLAARIAIRLAENPVID